MHYAHTTETILQKDRHQNGQTSNLLKITDTTKISDPTSKHTKYVTTTTNKNNRCKLTKKTDVDNTCTQR